MQGIVQIRGHNRRHRRCPVSKPPVIDLIGRVRKRIRSVCKGKCRCRPIHLPVDLPCGSIFRRRQDRITGRSGYGVPSC